MRNIAQEHCLNHAAREAVACCPECKQFYCRECVTEHDERVICTVCLSKISKKAESKKHRLSFAFASGAALLGVFTAWLFFFWTGRILLNTSPEFHDGTVWKQSILGE